MFFRYSLEVSDLKKHLQDVAMVEFRFELPIKADVRLGGQAPGDLPASDATGVVCVGTTMGEIEDNKCAAEIAMRCRAH